MIGQIVHLAFSAFTILLAVRIIGSWVPEISSQPWMLIIGKFTDPYLNLFRRFIPPIGGVLDLSPILGFFMLQFLEKFATVIFR